MRMQLTRGRLAGLVATAALMAGVEARADETAAPAAEPTAPAPAQEEAGDAGVAPSATAPEAPSPPSSNVTARVSAQMAAYQDSTATTVFTPNVGASVENPTSGWGVNGRYLVDMVSAASPDIVATASPRWSETRHAGSLGGQYKPGNFGGGVNASLSYTNDYLAFSGGGNLLLDLDEKNWTLLAGYTYGHDTVGRTGTAFAVFGHPVDFHNGTLGVTRLLGPSSVLSIGVDGVVEKGDQSKPYRYIPMFAPGAADKLGPGASADDVARLRIQARPLEQLPLDRGRVAVTARFAYRASSLTLRAEERLYADSWAMLASTTDVRVPLDVGRRVILWPHLRGHVQKGVNFWQRVYTATSAADLPALRTGDRELGPLWTAGLGGGARFGLGSSEDPFSFSILTSVDAYYTRFTDALYVTDRVSGLATVVGEVKF